jgi:ankyrin repeat protein
VELLIAKRADVNAKNKHGETPLWEAAARGNLEFLELLIANGADVNVKDDCLGDTPLHKAIWRGDRITSDSRWEEQAKEFFKKLLELLIAKGANVNAKNNYGKTHWKVANYNYYYKMRSLLLNKQKTIEELMPINLDEYE